MHTSVITDKNTEGLQGVAMCASIRIILALSIAVMVIPGNAHAGKIRLAKNVLGLWCEATDGTNDDINFYLRNDASAPKPDTPCKKGGDTDWRVINADGSSYGNRGVLMPSTVWTRAARLKVTQNGA
jgi:hypothetical protein